MSHMMVIQLDRVCIVLVQCLACQCPLEKALALPCLSTKPRIDLPQKRSVRAVFSTNLRQRDRPFWDIKANARSPDKSSLEAHFPNHYTKAGLEGSPRHSSVGRTRKYTAADLLSNLIPSNIVNAIACGSSTAILQ
jgi:hypothetical protein